MDTEPNRTPHFPFAKHTCHRGYTTKQSIHQNKTKCTSTGLSHRQTQNTTQTETDPTPGTQPPPASHRCPKRNSNSTPKESIDIPTIDLAPLAPHDPAFSLWNYKKNTAARFNMAYEAFIALYKHQIQPKKVLNCRPVINRKRKDSDQDYEANLKKEYLVRYEALVIENGHSHSSGN